jgi:protein TonB
VNETEPETVEASSPPAIPERAALEVESVEPAVPADEIAQKPPEFASPATMPEVRETRPRAQLALAAKPIVATREGIGNPASTGIEKMSAVSTSPSSRAPGEALIQARPRYRVNPPPTYPAAARRRKQEGTVLLAARVSERGRVNDVWIKESSGSEALDDAALRAVQRWEFEPARLGAVNLDSVVEVPVRFQLSP